MGMTRMERAGKAQLHRLLSKQGYPTYAKLLDRFDVNITQDPSVIAYMEPAKGRIVVNGELDIEQISVVVRHEILHEYLSHERRLLRKLAKEHDIDIDEADDSTLNELKNELYVNKTFNIAGDYEISNHGYTDEDKRTIRNIVIGGKIISGLVTEDEHPDWVNLSVEEMYDKLREENKNKSNDNSQGNIIKGKFINNKKFVVANGDIFGE